MNIFSLCCEQLNYKCSCPIPHFNHTIQEVCLVDLKKCLWFGFWRLLSSENEQQFK
jgi:hypothetical protein